MKERPRLRVRDRLKVLHISHTLDGFIEELMLVQEQFSEYINISIETETAYSDEYSETEIILYGDRDESDEEYEDRVRIEDKVKEIAKEEKKSRIEKERKEYERLKKKFEGK